METLGQIYKKLVDKKEATGNQHAWIDTETNTIWTLGGEGELFRYYSNGRMIRTE